eukprot:CAMPEP_0172879796 /NCGR_PEP_ID=MMETSP1075-20121228/113437_1 /TAXON_ID=2916 /ORGANISM="Ceratium fusus, Strain PA161109" /LENGTH=69 /DNA_ID=CAMNT_0013731871 /DNA_START=42 /DNA_END=248 /DNA_ORIENTATION=+
MLATTASRPELPPRDEIWKKTPTAARFAAISAGGWGASYGLTLFCMTFFEPGCQRGLCISLMILCVWWQ